MDTNASLKPESVDGEADEPALERILADWRCRLRATVDCQPRSGERGVRERALVRALLDYAECGTQPRHVEDASAEPLEALVLAGAIYGANMPRERLDPATLCNDLSELREAVCQDLRSREPQGAELTQHVRRFDQALSVALRAALTGGYRLTPADGRAFPELLEEVIADCTSMRPQPPARSGANLS